MKRWILSVVILLVIFAGSVTKVQAQLEVSDPILDYQIPLETSYTLTLTTQNNTSLMYQYQHYLHDLKQEVYDSEIYQELIDTYGEARDIHSTLNNVYSAYEFAMSAPTVLYNTLESDLVSYKSLETVHGDPYTLAQPIVNLINMGSTNTLDLYYSARVTPKSVKPTNYSSLTPNTQNVLRALSTDTSLKSSYVPTAVQRATDVQAHTTSAQKDLKTLETETFSSDTNEHTELATLQRINALLVLLTRAMQDSNQLATINTLSRTADEQQAQDTMYGTMMTNDDWTTLSSTVSNSMSGLSSALTQ